MKKLLSLALAIAMIMSIAVVALAADPNPVPVISLDTTAPSDGAVAGLAGDEAISFFKYSTDNNVMTMSNAAPSIAYGNKIYFALVNAAGSIVSDADAVKSMTVKADWELGEELVKSISIVKKRYATSPSVYGYFIEIALNSAALETSQDDLVATLTVKKSTGDFKLDIAGETYFDFDVNIPISYSLLDAEDMSVITDSAKLYNFDQDIFADEDEFEFSFAEFPDASYVIDVTSQGKIVLKTTGDYNASVAAKYPLANLDFFVGNGASFNKIGELFIPADEGSFLYVVNSDGTLTLSSAEYDSYEEGFFLKTRTIGSYAISDVELELAAEEPVADVVEAVDEPAANANPGTGAAL